MSFDDVFWLRNLHNVIRDFLKFYCVIVNF